MPSNPTERLCSPPQHSEGPSTVYNPQVPLPSCVIGALKETDVGMVLALSIQGFVTYQRT